MQERRLVHHVDVLVLLGETPVIVCVCVCVCVSVCPCVRVSAPDRNLSGMWSRNETLKCFSSRSRYLHNRTTVVLCDMLCDAV